jgi:hypothetical protein
MPKHDEPHQVQFTAKIPRNFHRALKLHCVKTETSLTQFLVRAVREKLDRVGRGGGWAYQCARPRSMAVERASTRRPRSPAREIRLQGSMCCGGTPTTRPPTWHMTTRSVALMTSTLSNVIRSEPSIMPLVSVGDGAPWCLWTLHPPFHRAQR